MKILRKAVGRYRMWNGWCPECNSDAPYVDICKVCYGLHHSGKRVKIHDPKIIWENFQRKLI